MNLSPENTLYVRPEDIAPWVPRTVHWFARANEINACMVSLLKDDRARPVWREVLRHDMVNPDTVYMPKAVVSGSRRFTMRELGALALFERLQDVSWDISPIKRADIDKMTRPVRDAAALLRQLLDAPTIEMAFDEKTAAAVPIVAELLEREAERMERSVRSNIVERQSARRGKKDSTRVFGRRVAGLMVELYGSPLRQTVATITTLITGENVTRDEIENWAP